MAAAYVNVDLMNPNKCWFMFNMTKLTVVMIVNTVFGVFNQDANDYLPKAVLNTGFPKGLFISWSLAETVLPNGVIIKSGFNLNGTLNLFGYEMSAYIAFDPTKQIAFDIRADPIYLLGGVFQISRSLDNWREGTLYPLFICARISCPPAALSCQTVAYVVLRFPRPDLQDERRLRPTALVQQPVFGGASRRGAARL
jgi:hypothetical protein